MNNFMFEKKKNSNYLTIFLLILSFVWITAYPVLSSFVYDYYFSYGNFLNLSSDMFANAAIFIVISSLVSWIGFELILIVYRFVLSFRIYSFVAPQHKVKNDMRTFFIYRNVVFGLFLNICFVFPYLHIFAPIIDLIATLTTFICFANYIKKTYSEPLIGHFVFKCFITPVVLYEILIVALNLMEVL